MKLRDYQQRAVEDVRKALRTVKRVLLVAPTGSGKTVVASEIVRLAGLRSRRVLFLAHRTEILDQTSAKLRAIGIEHGRIQAGWTSLSEAILPVQVASVPTLARRLAYRPGFDIVIHDEAHHASAKSFLSVLQAYPDAIVIGMTATPYRLDGRGLGDLDGKGYGFESIVCVAQIHELIERGYLVPPRIYSPPHADLSGVHTVAGDYNQGEAAALLNKPKLIGDMIEHWRKYANGRLTLGFAGRVEHSQAIVDRFNAAGIPAEHVDADSGDEREAALARFRRGETRVLFNVGLFTEGTDIPACSAVICARPTQSPSLWRQICGRPLRTLPEDVGRPRPEWLKPDAVILDHVGNCERLGLPTDPEVYTLMGVERRSKDPVPSVATCPKCFACYSATAERCPACGFARPVKPMQSIEEHAGELEEVTPAQAYAARVSPEERVRLLAKFIAEGKVRGWKPGAAKVRFKAMFRAWPTGNDEAAALAVEFPRYLVAGGACRRCGSTVLRLGRTYEDSRLTLINCGNCGRGLADAHPEFAPLVERWRTTRAEADRQLAAVAAEVQV